MLPTILDAIGQTPMVRINKLAQDYGIQCELCTFRYAKREMVNKFLMKLLMFFFSGQM